FLFAEDSNDNDSVRTKPFDTEGESVQSCVKEGVTVTQMSDKFISVIDLLKQLPMIDDAGKKSPRNKSAFLAKLRGHFKFQIKFVIFPGRFQGRAVAAITEKEA